MKAINQILEGVTAGGKWENASANRILSSGDSPTIASVSRAADAEFIVRACSTWPELVRALEGLVKFSRELCEDTGISANYPSLQLARAALEAALKD